MPSQYLRNDPCADLRAWDRAMHIYLVLGLISGLILTVRYVAQDRRPLPEPKSLAGKIEDAFC